MGQTYQNLKYLSRMMSCRDVVEPINWHKMRNAGMECKVAACLFSLSSDYFLLAGCVPKEGPGRRPFRHPGPSGTHVVLTSYLLARKPSVFPALST